MNHEEVTLELQVHLAEYTALRAEILELIKWRDSLVFISLGISGAIFSFQFSQHVDNSNKFNQYGFYLIAPLASLIGGLWMVNTWRINRLGGYINQTLSKRISQLLGSMVRNELVLKETSVLQWESSNARLKYKWERRICEWLIYIATFIMPGVLAQFFIYNNLMLVATESSSRIINFPLVFLLNWILVSLCMFLFMLYLLKGFAHKKKKVIEVV